MSASDQPLVPFDPVHLRARHDGWTAQRQIAFVEALAESACVEEAARRTGMSVASAYALRKRADAGPFRDAWDSALDMAMHRLEQAVLSRAIHGVARPIFYKGEQVGEWRHHDEKLAMFLLRYRRPQRFGPWHDRLPPEICQYLQSPREEDNSAPRFQADCDEIAETAPWDEEASEGTEADDSSRA